MTSKVAESSLRRAAGVVIVVVSLLLSMRVRAYRMGELERPAKWASLFEIACIVDWLGPGSLFVRQADTGRYMHGLESEDTFVDQYPQFNRKFEKRSSLVGLESRPDVRR